MPNPSAPMFTRIFDASPVVPGALHRAAWRHAVTTGNTPLKRLLIARADAPADLTAHYATLTDTELLGVYWGRRDVGDQLLIAGLAGERRASVLAEALERSRQHPAVAATAAEVFLARPTKVLAEALVDLHAARVTPALAEALLGFYDQTPVTDRLDAKVPALVDQLGPDRARSLLPRITHPQLAAALIAFDLGDALVHTTIARIGTEVMRRTTQKDVFRLASEQMSLLIRAARTGRADAATVEVLRTLLSGYHGDTVVRWRQNAADTTKTPQHRAWPEGAGDESRTVATAHELAAPDRVREVGTATWEELADLAVSADAGVVAAAAHRLLSSDPADASWQDAAVALLHHPLTTRTDRIGLLNAFAVRGSGPRFFDPIVRFPDDTEAREIWCAAFPRQVLETHGWEPFGGLRRAVDLVPQWASSQDRALEEAARTALAMGVGPDVLRLVPLNLVSRVWYGSRVKASDMTLLAFADVLADELGDDPAAWTLYEQLKDEFCGTLGELLETCRALAA